MAFSLGCFACCTPCDPCTAECDTTPDDNFEVVYQANDTDGALQWSGDAMGPIDGPYPGFEGSGPFSQTISLAEDFSVTMPGARFPCYARIKFWRNVGGGEGSETVTSSVTITCNSGKVDIGPVVLSEGESAYFGPDPEVSGATYRLLSLDAIPLVSGGDDQSLAVIASPIYGGTAECSPSSISVTATISWSNAAIQHNLYGTFVECFDDVECGCEPETIYLTISNFDAGGVVGNDNIEVDVNGTYALSQAGRLSGGCMSWANGNAITNPPTSGVAAIASVLYGAFVYVGGRVPGASPGGLLEFGVGIETDYASLAAMVCGDTISGSAAGEWRYRGQAAPNGAGYFWSFDWELST